MTVESKPPDRRLSGLSRTEMKGIEEERRKQLERDAFLNTMYLARCQVPLCPHSAHSNRCD
jgi:hypothetical protein